MQAKAMNGLSEEQVKTAITALLAKKRELLVSVDAVNNFSLAVAQGAKADSPAETANTCTDRATYAALSERAQRSLDQVCEALARIANGTYGLCVSCGKNIRPERIAVIPQALRCLNCQREFEKTNRVGRHKAPSHGLFR